MNKQQIKWLNRSELVYAPPEEVEEWLDVEDQDFIEKVRLTGGFSSVNSWPVECGKSYHGPYYSFHAEHGWTFDDKYVAKANRTNSAHFRDEQIASRERQRKVRAELVALQEEQEKARKKRERANYLARHRRETRRYREAREAEARERQRQHDLRMEAQTRERAAAFERARANWRKEAAEIEAVRNESAHETQHQCEVIRQHALNRVYEWLETAPITFAVQSLMTKPDSQWTVESLAMALGKPTELVRAVVRKLVHDGKIRPVIIGRPEP